MKLQLRRLEGGYLDAALLNTWATTLEAAFENTLSRDGSVPNNLSAPLDLNGQPLLNSGGADTSPDAVMTRKDVDALVSAYASGYVRQRVEQQTASAAQTLVTLTTTTYHVGANNVAVYIDGVRVFNFTETSDSSFTMLTPLTAGQKISVVTNDYLATANLPPHTHAWSDVFNTPVFATRWPAYSEITSVPSTFPPSAHQHDAADITSGRLQDARRGVYIQAGAPTLGAGDAGALWFW